MKKLLASLALASSALLCATPSMANIVVTLTPSSQHVNVGDDVFIDVSISGLGTEVLSAMDLDMLFNSTVLSGTGLSTFGAQFGNPPDPSTTSFFDIFFQIGNTEVQGGSLLDDDDLAAIQTDDAFQFFTYKFKALTDGFSYLNYGADPDFERAFVGRRAQLLDVTVVGACVSVGQVTDCNRVPEPASLSLASLALLGVFAPAALRRRRLPTAA